MFLLEAGEWVCQSALSGWTALSGRRGVASWLHPPEAAGTPSPPVGVGGAGSRTAAAPPSRSSGSSGRSSRAPVGARLQGASCTHSCSGSKSLKRRNVCEYVRY